MVKRFDASIFLAAAFFIFLLASARTGVIASNLWLLAHERLYGFMVMVVMITIGAMNMPLFFMLYLSLLLRVSIVYQKRLLLLTLSGSEY